MISLLVGHGLSGRAPRVVVAAAGPGRVEKTHACQLEREAVDYLLHRAAFSLDEPPPGPRAVDVMDRPYASIVRARRPADLGEWHTLLLRYGYLVGFAWLLGAFDLHHENVVISGAFPVPVDLELIDEVTPWRARSIFSTGLVPYPHRVDGYGFVDPSPLGVLLAGGTPGASSFPLLRDALAAGFDAAVEDEGGIAALTAWLHGLPVRRMLRPTRAYSAWIAALRNGAMTQHDLAEHLARPFERGAMRVAAEARDLVVAHELRELRAGRAPRIEGAIGSTLLRCGDVDLVEALHVEASMPSEFHAPSAERARLRRAFTVACLNAWNVRTGAIPRKLLAHVETEVSYVAELDRFV